MPSFEAVTDLGGRARLELEHGEYWLLVEASGKARWSALLQLEEPAHELSVVLAPARPLRVGVRDEDDRPIEGALVMVFGADPVPHAERTSARGEVVFHEVGEIIDSLRVTAPGHAPSSVRPSERDVTVRLSSPSQLRVTVRDAGGQPASHAQLWLSGLDVWPPREIEAGPDGRGVWDGLSRGTYDVRAAREMHVASTSLTLDRGESRELTLDLQPGRSVTVRVADAENPELPVAGADVVLVEDGLGPFPLHGQTDAEGRVTLGPLPRGPATVSARARGFMPESALPVPAGASEARVLLTRGAELHGELIDDEGIPVAGASLEVVGNDIRGRPIVRSAWLDAAAPNPLAPASQLLPLGELGVLPGPLPRPGRSHLTAASGSPWVSDAAGRFRLQDVPPGRVRVLARHPEFVESASPELTLAPAGQASLRIVLQRGAALTGRLVDGSGRPVARARIEALARQGLAQASQLTREDGSFAFSALPAELDLFVARPTDRYRFVMRRELTLQPGETRELELRLPAERAALEVVVLGDDRRPLAGALVSVLSVLPEAPLRRSLVSDSSGLARVADAVGLELALRIQAPGFGLFETRLESAPERVEVTLEPAVRLSGRVTQVRGRQSVSGARVVLLQGGERRMTRSDAVGEFEFRDASPGPARLSVSHPGFVTRVSDVFIRATGRADRPFELAAIDLSEAGAVYGNVVDSTGAVVRGARVGVGLVPAFLPAGSEPSGMAVSDAAGAFRLDGVPVGRVTLSAYAAALGRGSVDDVEVRAGETTGPIEIQLLGAATGANAGGLPSLAVTLGERTGEVGGIDVVIVDVAAGSEAERAGLRAGDVLRRIDGVVVEDMGQARQRLSGSEGSDVIIDVDRQATALSINVRREAVRR